MSDETERLAVAAALERLRSRFEHAQVRALRTETHELSAEVGRIKQLRTNENTTLALMAVDAGRKGAVDLNRSDAGSVATAVDDLVDVIAGGRADDANAIAAAQPAACFDAGPAAPDYDAMVDRLDAFIAHARAKHPLVILRDVIITYERRAGVLMNSAGVDFSTDRRGYSVMLGVAAKDGEKLSSLQYTSYTTHALDRPLHECGLVESVLQQAGEQIETAAVPGKFRGRMIIAPSALPDFIGFLTGSIGDGALIGKSSIYADKLGERVASPLLTARFTPVGDETVGGYWITGDGYRAADSTLLAAGRLETFLLSDYGARKTGGGRAVNDGGNLVVEAGATPYAAMVAGVEEGIVLMRFSGGRPNSRGDFSGIAKNSYYIRDGKIRHPVSETMVSGNMAAALRDVVAVSRERVDFGASILPWVAVDNITVS